MLNILAHHRQNRQGEREGQASNDVSGEHDPPQTDHAHKPIESPARDDRQNGGENVFGEQLLASKNYNQEADGIAEFGNDRPPIRPGKISRQRGLGEKREADGDASEGSLLH